MEDRGWTCLELVVALAAVALMACMAAPLTARAIDAHRSRDAASFVASRLRFARQQAVFQGRSVGLVFQLAGGRWTFSICTDGNHNGLRRAEILAGTDTCVEGPHDLSAMFPGTLVAVDPVLPGPEGSAASPNPVRFGTSQIASFSPHGSCTAGTLFLRSVGGLQYAVRVGNMTGRTRLLYYDTGSRGWVDG